MKVTPKHSYHFVSDHIGGVYLMVDGLFALIYVEIYVCM